MPAGRGIAPPKEPRIFRSLTLPVKVAGEFGSAAGILAPNRALEGPGVRLGPKVAPGPKAIRGECSFPSVRTNDVVSSGNLRQLV